ncbi:MAG TPA: SAF domain-containing protein [Amnibacterium sp.]|jgi:hypothetical protein|uniref:SAF domain-containing protein n=1 Tax=Amnibacterium sp. TaxID=1872496 RepID=UPI002F9517F9
MATLPTPLPRRLRLDPRIVLGLVLVAASTLGVTAVVQSLNRTEPVYRAAGPLVAGAHISAADLVPTPVRLGPADPLYLTGPVPADGYVVTRTIAAGEMVPLSALGSASAVDVASVVVDLSTRLSGSIVPGAVVDVWSAPRKTGSTTEYGAPVVLVSGATVVRTIAPQGIVQAAQQNTVELQVPRGDVAAVLEAVAGSARISAVAVSQPVHR